MAIGVLGGVVSNLSSRLAVLMGAPSWMVFLVWLGTSFYVGYWWGRNHPELT